MRVVAILATYNEERFIEPCLESLFEQGIQAYLVDNDSTDRTVAIASRYLGRGLLGVERFPRDGIYRWSSLLERKAQIAATLDADWFMHVDADEIYPSPRPGITLCEALADIDAQGYNAVNFYQYTFVPTQESPDHEHPGFLETMKWYYPFIPTVPHLIRAWKRQPAPVDLAQSGGHRVHFAGLNLYPESLPMRHYHFLSLNHAIRKYVSKQYDPHEVGRGWHTWRATLRPDTIKLPSRAELKTYTSDHELDPSNPRASHCFVLAPGAGASPWREWLRLLGSRLRKMV
ncbi:MAG TPA: glycosyltransferase family A protein [Longimicrobium sp.]|jgi:glycosyltransferase involved in cell wall biosynthesis